ncbi:hypothetical protein [Clostridium algidicarnis]|uniref:hypothetical protein n=1 Tax=Clostridium algidicarnis TaxID=37659 RepID=UPI001C0D11E4|nr:hypothetical protein [Clostridium algidicarnis]MBU3228204.1 hypothetical protein [Clostridium algidicarnis]MBU3252088.1 hypothetical protein [Clostridium algidicarnis]
MKKGIERLLGIATVPIIWGAFVDLKYGEIASFITRVICVTAIGYLVVFMSNKGKAILNKNR